MRKHNTLAKKIKKQFLIINYSIESFFNKIKSFLLYKKKLSLLQNNKVFLVISIFVILSLSALVVPSFYNKTLIQSKIQNQISNNYEIDLKFNKKLIYGLFPKPHFIAYDISILNGKKKIADVKELKIFIGLKKFFSINQVKIKDLVFKDVEFNINKNDISFFIKLLKTEPNDNKIEIKDSSVFFKNKDDEVLFINRIDNIKFFYDPNKLANVLLSKNKIFNLPFKLNIINDKFNKNIYSKFDSKKIRLVIENEIDYTEKFLKGVLDILLVNKNTSLNYEIKKDSLKFSSNENKKKYNGYIDFKPFYFSVNFNYDGLSTKNFLNEESVLTDVLKSELLNNENVNADIGLNVKNITNIEELNSLFLKLIVEEGKIGLSNSNLMWKKDLKLILNESFLELDNGDILLIGKVILDFKDIDNFYKSFQIKKIDRKKIKKIELDFVYNFLLNEVSFDNARIDNETNSYIDEYINSFNKSKNRIFNKITFKNFVNNFFDAYAG